MCNILTLRTVSSEQMVQICTFEMSETTLYIMSLKVNIWGHHNVAVTMYPGKVSLQKCPAAAAVCVRVCVCLSRCVQ